MNEFTETDPQWFGAGRRKVGSDPKYIRKVPSKAQIFPPHFLLNSRGPQLVTLSHNGQRKRRDWWH